ncbi:MAG TPA: right-handed parallel beta-helix repeat-containing protein [Streptosporangiaceae bacterium]|nr:right-handed parallel beta-helix repeat-containing protein [Streptosporangiaceae bacterium]
MSKITGYATIAVPKPAVWIPVTDPTDTSMAGTGTTEKISARALLAGLGPTGTDDTANIQGMLSLAGKCLLGAGVFLISQSLTFSSSTGLAGNGPGITTVRAASGYAAAQVGSNAGMNMLMTTGNGSVRQSRITVADLTLDMNESAAGFPLPGYATQALCSPASFYGVDGLTIRNVEIINSVGYAQWLNNCTSVRVEDCTIVTGQASLHSWNQQDAIHVSDCTGVIIAGCTLTTGTSGGDDAIAIQGITSGCADVAVKGNVILAAGAHGISLNLGGASITGVAISGNTIKNTQNEAIFLGFQTWNSSSITGDVSITGNVCRNVALANSSSGITLQDATNVTGGGHTGATGWKGVAIEGNVFEGFANTSGFGLYAMTGDGLTVAGNTFRNWNAVRGIVIGDNISSTPITVKNCEVSDNIVDLSAATAATPYGIAVIDSPDTVVSGNKVTGPGAAGNGIWVLAIGTAVTGTAVTGNRVKGWATAILEANGGAAPDYNSFVGNNCHGCTAFITTVGTHDVPATMSSVNVVA